MVIKLVNKSISGRRRRSGGMLASGYKVGIGLRESKCTVGGRQVSKSAALKARHGGQAAAYLPVGRRHIENLTSCAVLKLRTTIKRGRVCEIKNLEFLCGDRGRCRLYFLLVSPGKASGYRVGQDSRSEMDEILRERGRILHVADGGSGWDALHRGKQDVRNGRFERFALGISR